VKSDVRIFPDLEALSRAAARSLADRIRAIVSGGGRFDLALSGGNTPRPLYRLLAAEYRDEIAWPHVHLFWSDERYVPQSDLHSNYRLARENLLDCVPIPAENIHPMPTNLPEADDAARASASRFWGSVRTDIRHPFFPALRHSQKKNAVWWPFMDRLSHGCVSR
jgi:6-phosphogluconolactonase